MNNGFYKHLAEGLEKKYTKKFNLTEAWNNTMPDWLKQAMSTSAWKHDDKSKTKDDIRNNKANYKGKEWDNPKYKTGQPFFNPDYQKPRGTYGGRKNRTLYGAFVTAGIDPAQCEYIECECPSSSRDPIVNPPNIPIWGFNCTITRWGEEDKTAIQVYAKGINELEKVYYNNKHADELGYDIPFKSVSFKKLKENCDYFCYIPGDKIGKKDFDAERGQRAEINNWSTAGEGALLTRGTPGERGNVYDNNNARVVTSTRDKSGYLKIPTADKYVYVLNRAGARKFAHRVEQLEQDIRQVWNEISSGLVSKEVADVNSTEVRNAIDRLQYANNYYGYALERLSKLSTLYDTNSNEFLDALNDSDIEYNIRESERLIEKVKDITGQIRLSTLDF